MKLQVQLWFTKKIKKNVSLVYKHKNKNKEASKYVVNLLKPAVSN